MSGESVKLEILLSAKEMAGTAFTQLEGRIKSLTSRVFSFNGAIAGMLGAAGAGGIAKMFLDTARSFEKFETQLKTITGSSAQAKSAMDWISEFARTTPFELGEVTDAFVRLKSYGFDAVKFIPALGDTAAAMGKSLTQTVEMFADAATGEFERLKEFGVRAESAGDQVTFSWAQNGQQMQVTAQKTQAGITAALDKIFTRFRGGMEEQSKTWDGLWSNFQDGLARIEKKIMDAGAFDALKGYLANINKEMDRWVEENAQLIAQKVPEYLDAVKTGIAGTYDKLVLIKSVYDAVPEEIRGAAGAGIVGRVLFGGWGPAKVVAALYAINAGLENLNMGLGSFAKSWKDYQDAVGHMGEVLSGQRDWNTGASLAPIETNLHSPSMGSYTPSAPGGGSGGGTTFTAEIDPTGRQYIQDAADAAIADWSAYYDALQEVIKQRSERITADVKAWIDEQEKLQQYYRENDLEEARRWDREFLENHQRALDAAKKLNEQALKEQEKLNQEIASAFAGWASGFSRELNDIVWGTQTTFQDIASSFGKMITQMMIQLAIIEPMLKSFKKALSDTGSSGGVDVGGFFRALFSGGSSDYDSAAPGAWGAKGLVFDAAGVKWHGTGDVLTAPTVFPLRNGSWVGGGEAGPEGIFPLRRLPNGDLGVQSSGQMPNVNVNIVNNAGADVRVGKARQGAGGMEIDVMVDDLTAGKVGQPGSALHRALRQMGAKPQLSRR